MVRQSNQAHGRDLGGSAPLLWAVGLFAAVLLVWRLLPGWIAAHPGLGGAAAIRLFIVQDTPFMPAVLVAALICWAASARFGPGAGALGARGAPFALALAAFGAALAAKVFAHHNFNLSGDEFVPAFQARIFLEGRILAPLSAADLPLARALQPVFVMVDAAHGLWGSHYRPVYAAMLAGAAWLADASLLNPAMAALAALATHRVIRRLRPDRPEAALIGAAAMVASPQFIATAGSGFSFPAHLALNMCWLACFVRGGARGHLAAMAIGVLALGLHQVHVHALFAAPFGLALLLGALPGRAWALAYGAVYVTAMAMWMMWPELAVALQTGDWSALPRDPMAYGYARGLFGAGPIGPGVVRISAPPLPDGPILAISMARFALWLSPALLILFCIGAAGWRRLGTIEKLCVVSVALSAAFRCVASPDQMHGWGYRYLHPWLGAMAVVAAAACAAPPAALAPRRLLRFAGLAVAASAVALVPWRLAQVDDKVGPRARAQAWLQGLDADMVAIDTEKLWFGRDLVRNDPFLRDRPILLMRDTDAGPLLAAPIAAGRVATGLEDELRGFGVSSGTALEPEMRPAPVAPDG